MVSAYLEPAFARRAEPYAGAHDGTAVSALYGTKTSATELLTGGRLTRAEQSAGISGVRWADPPRASPGQSRSWPVFFSFRKTESLNSLLREADSLIALAAGAAGLPLDPMRQIKRETQV